MELAQSRELQFSTSLYATAEESADPFLCHLDRSEALVVIPSVVEGAAVLLRPGKRTCGTRLQGLDLPSLADQCSLTQVKRHVTGSTEKDRKPIALRILRKVFLRNRAMLFEPIGG